MHILKSKHAEMRSAGVQNLRLSSLFVSLALDSITHRAHSELTKVDLLAYYRKELFKGCRNGKSQ